MSRLLTSRPRILYCWLLSVQAHFGPLLHVCSELDAANSALSRIAMLEKSCFVQNFASVHLAVLDSIKKCFSQPVQRYLSNLCVLTRDIMLCIVSDIQECKMIKRW